MSAFRAALRTEIRRAGRDRALVCLAVLFGIISMYAAWNGVEWADRRQAALDSVARQERANHESSIARIKAAADRGQAPGISAGGLAAGVWNHPALPLSPFAPLAVGQAFGYPYDAKFHAMTPTHRMFEGAGADLGNPSGQAVGPFDLAFVVVFLLPLFLFGASYDLWAQERETGTSVLLLSQPTTLAPILAAKTLARGGALLLVAVLELKVLIFWIALRGVAVMEFAAAAAIVLLYGAFWLLVAVLVNLFARRCASAAIACVTIWLSGVVLLPALLSASVDVARPAPPQAEYVAAVRLSDLELEEHRPATSPATGAPRSQRLRDAVGEAQRRDDLLMPILRRHQDALTERRELSDSLRFLSPAVIAQDAIERLAGTDADRAISFQSQAAAHLHNLRVFVLQDEPREGEGFEEAIRRIPVFHFEATNPIRRQAFRADMSALAAWIACLSLAILFALQGRAATFTSDSPETC